MSASLCHLLLALALVSPESDHARHLYEQQRFAEAAIAYEELWAAQASSTDLFNAALARQAAGQLTQANLYFRMISGHRDLGPEERTLAAERVSLLQLSLTKIELEIRPGRALGPDAELLLQRGADVISIKLHDIDELLPLDKNGDPLPIDRERPDSGPRTWTLFLEPGEWTLHVIPRSDRAAFNTENAVVPQVVMVPPRTTSDLTISAHFALVPETTAFEIDIGEAAAARGVHLQLIDPLRIRDFKPSIHQPSLTLTLPTGVWRYQLLLKKHRWLLRPQGPTLAGVLEVSQGTSMSRQSFADELDREIVDETKRWIFATATASNALGFAALGGGLLGGSFRSSRSDAPTQRYDLGSAGAFFLGSGAGLIGTTLSTVLGAKRRTWLTEFALGGMTTISAVTWYGLIRSSLNNQIAGTSSDNLEPQLYGSMGLVGLGTALSLGAASALLLRRRKTARPPRTKTTISVQKSLTRGALNVSF